MATNFNLSCIKLCWLTALLLIPGLSFGSESILTYPKAIQDRGALEGILTNPKLGGQVQKLFAPSTEKYLRGTRAEHLIAAYRIDFSTGEAAGRFKKLAQAKGFSVESNQSVKRQSIDLEKDQWQFYNQDVPYERTVLKTDWIRAVEGEDIGLFRAPKEVPSSNKILVAVIDSGIDLSHNTLDPELANPLADLVIHRSEKECAAHAEYRACTKKAGSKLSELNACEDKYSKLDTDQNGYPMDCNGWNVVRVWKKNDATQDPKYTPDPAKNDFIAMPNIRTQVQGDQDPSDSKIGHGTHIAGIIGALSGNHGVRGISQNVEILPVKVILSEPNPPMRPQSLPMGQSRPQAIDETNSQAMAGTMSGGRSMVDMVARGLLYAIAKNARVINISLSWPVRIEAQTDLLRTMINLARDRGIVVVAAAANDATHSQNFPCAYSGVVCVGAHGPDGALVHWSNHGSSVDLAAPGIGILSTFPFNLRTQAPMRGFEYQSGTSQAAPMVTGAVARLLAQGMSPRDAVATLFLSARPQRNGTDTKGRFVQFGNLDLSREATKEALFLPVEKQSVRTYWNPSKAIVPLSIEIKNLGFNQSAIEFTGRLVHQDLGALKEAKLSVSRWSFSNVKADQTLLLQSQINIENTKVDGRLFLELKYGNARTLRIPIEIAIPLFPELAQAAPERFKFKRWSGVPFEIDPKRFQDALRSVTYLPSSNLDSPGTDYLLMKQDAAAWTFQWIRNGEVFPSVKIAPLADPKRFQSSELMYRKWIDLDQDGSPKLVAIFREQSTETGAYSLRFWITDKNFKQIQNFEYENPTIPLPEDFQWHKVGGKKLIPAWAGPGTTPSVEHLPFDEWDPRSFVDRRLTDQPQFRFYYMNDGVLRTLAPPKGYLFARHLEPTLEQIKNGETPVLMMDEDFRVQKYFRAVVRDLKVTEMQELKQSDYFNLARAPMRGGVMELDGVQGTKGMKEATYFASLKWPVGFSVLEQASLDVSSKIEPKSTLELDTTTLIHSVFRAKSSKSFKTFTQTHYNLEFHDFGAEKIQSASTSLNNNSFLEENALGKAVFSMTVKNQSQAGTPSEMLPAAWIPDGGASDTPWATEVITPHYNEGGRLERLVRPAKLRFEKTETCQQILLPTLESSERVVRFLCTDGILSTSLSY